MLRVRPQWDERRLSSSMHQFFQQDSDRGSREFQLTEI